jgi:hypothetical protein
MALMRRWPLLFLVVLPCAPSSAPPLSGAIVDTDGPVSGATVRIQASPLVTRTDAAGRFALPHPGGTARVTAAKDGYLIAGADANAGPLTLALERVPAGDCEAYAWVDPAPDVARPQNCGNCHPRAYREWAAGGHARSATNRRFRNLYDGTDWHGRPDRGWNLLKELPAGAGVCAACHAPTAELSADTDYDFRRVEGVAARGVHCDYCHKVAGPGEGELGLTHGRYFLRLSRPERGQRFFGPLDDVDRGEDVASPFQRDSRLCAACHEGTVFGVHAYSTYSEWRASPASRQGVSCQQCHMAAAADHTNIAPGHGGHEREPRTLANHTFFAGGQEAMLRRRLSLTVVPERDPVGVTVNVTVRADGVGHRVPTGFPDRHLVLVVEGFDVAGAAVSIREGPTLPVVAGPTFASRPGKLFAKRFRDFDGRAPTPFWRADPESIDTRLRPGEPDRSAYRFPPGVARVRVRVLYRRFWPEVAAAKDWPDNERLMTEREMTVP